MRTLQLLLFTNSNNNSCSVLIIGKETGCRYNISYWIRGNNSTAGTAITPVTITNAGLLSYYSISPAISNGLSFNTNTGAISGVPIVASDPVTYVTFKEIEKMAIARSLVSLFFIFRNKD
jgi:hypothetical protein